MRFQATSLPEAVVTKETVLQDGAHVPTILVLVAGVIGCERSPASTPETLCSLNEGKVACWISEGSDRSVGAGLGHTVRIPGRVSATTVGSLGEFACAIADGSVFCWGVGKKGELGDGVESSERRGPVRVRDVSSAVEIAGAWWSACALDRDGIVTCWGSLSGIEERQSTNEPLPTRIVEGAKSLAAGDLQTCVVSSSVLCWGGNYPGPPAGYPGPEGQYSTAGVTLIPGTDGADSVRAEGHVTCATWADRRERCWSTTPMPLGPLPPGLEIQ